MNILCLGPHPDDLEIGAAGTLIKYAEAGHSVYLMIMTKGEMGGHPDSREDEQIISAKIIGAKDIFWGGYTDTNLLVDARSIGIVENIIKKVKPDLIFCNFGEDTHQDHRALAQIMHSAGRNSTNILLYETPTTAPSFNPVVFTDITDVIPLKTETLLAHKSQTMKTNITDTSIMQIAASMAIFRGTQSRVKYAEGFVPLRMFLEIT